MGKQRDLRVVIVAVSALAAGAACSKKKSSNSSDGGAGVTSNTGAPVLLAPASVNLAGIPKDPSKDQTLDVVVGPGNGGAPTTYRYALLTGAADCSAASYSADTAITTAISGDVGADGVKLLCVLGKNAAGEMKTPTTATWTHDATGPVVALVSPAFPAFSPATTAGNTTNFKGSAVDPTSGLALVQVSLARDVDGVCLNGDKSAFLDTCPAWFTPSDMAAWSLEVSDNLFAHGQSYTITVHAVDKTGNETTFKQSLPYDSVPPAAAYTMTVTPEAGQLALSWPTVPDATGYVVVRGTAGAPKFVPTASTGYAAGQDAGNGETIVYSAKAPSVTDTGLSPASIYYYMLYAYDDARNYSTGIGGSGQPLASFGGLTHASVIGANRIAALDWQRLDDGYNDPNNYVYSAYTGDTAGAEGATAAATTTGKSTLTLPLGGSSLTPAMYVRATDPANKQDANKRETVLNLASGYQHKLGGDRLYNGLDSFNASIDSVATGVVDSWGNVVFSANQTVAYVLCQEKKMAPYCLGRRTGKVYAIGGSDGYLDGPDARDVYSGVGTISAMAVDRSGNVYISDTLYLKVRAFCFNTGPASGFCAGKSVNTQYTLTGNNSSAAAVDDSAAAGGSIGFSYGLAVDASGNVMIADQSNKYIYGICYTATGPVCAGKTVGHIYRVGGNGGSGYTVSNAMTGAIGSPKQLALDSSGNLYYSEANAAVRVLCLTAAGTYCTGKTAGFGYTLAGNGVGGGVGANDADPLATSFTTPYGVAVDPTGNVHFTDQNNRRTFVLCYATTAGMCRGVTAGHVYYGACTGANSDFDGDAGVCATLDPWSVSSDAYGNILFTDHPFGYLKVLCNDGTGGLCVGRAEGAVYRIAGTGNNPTAPVNGQSSAHFDPGYNVRGVAVDSKGNFYYSNDSQYDIVALCSDVTSVNTFCTGKTAGSVYIVAGAGQNYCSSGAPYCDNVAFANVGLGQSGGLTIDHFDNLILSQNNIYGIYALCMNTLGGFCAGKTVGHMYLIAGTPPSRASPGDGVLAKGGGGASEIWDSVSGLAADGVGNIVYYDNNQRYVQSVCVTASGACVGKVAGPPGTGYTYHYAGNGGALTTPVNGTPLANFGVIGGMAFDASSNLYLVDTNKNVIFKVDTPYTHQTVLLTQHSTSDGVDNTAESAGDFTLGGSIALDANGNIYFDDYSWSRIRVICGSTAGWCNGKDSLNNTKQVNYVYNYSGSSASTNPGPTNLPISNNRIGVTNYATNYNIMAIGRNNDLYYYDQMYHAIRYVVGY